MLTKKEDVGEGKEDDKSACQNDMKAVERLSNVYTAKKEKSSEMK